MLDPSGSVRLWYRTIKKQATELCFLPKVILLISFLQDNGLYLLKEIKTTMKKKTVKLPQVILVTGLLDGFSLYLLKKCKKTTKKLRKLPQVNFLIGFLIDFGQNLLKFLNTTMRKRGILLQVAACLFLLQISNGESIKQNWIYPQRCKRVDGGFGFPVYYEMLYCRNKPTITQEYYRCKSGSKCIPWPCYCDSMRDCPDGDDEKKPCELTCPRKCWDEALVCKTWPEVYTNGMKKKALICASNGDVYWNHCHYKCLKKCKRKWTFADDVDFFGYKLCVWTRSNCFKIAALYEKLFVTTFRCSRDGTSGSGTRYPNKYYLRCDKLSVSNLYLLHDEGVGDKLETTCSELPCVTDWETKDTYCRTKKPTITATKTTKRTKTTTRKKTTPRPKPQPTTSVVLAQTSTTEMDLSSLQKHCSMQCRSQKIEIPLCAENGDIYMNQCHYKCIKNIDPMVGDAYECEKTKKVNLLTMIAELCAKEDKSTIAVSLTGGRSKNEGTVMAEYGARRGLICANSWSRLEGDVVCRMLGFRDALSVTANNEYGYRGSPTMVLEKIYCSGQEKSLFLCSYFEEFKFNSTRTDCRVDQTAGVACRTCDTVKSDLVFILDTSKNVTDPSFFLMKEFLKDFVMEANIEDGSIRVGLVLYNTDIEFSLSTYSTKMDLITAINEIDDRNGSFNTENALETMHSRMFTQGNGDRPHVENICIILRDGSSNNNATINIPEAEAAREKGIHMYAIGIDLNETKDLDGFASEPVEDNTFSLQESSQLKDIKDKVFAAMCGRPKCEFPQWRCTDDTLCVPFDSLCDGHKDCLDGSDEFTCGNKRCSVDKNGTESKKCADNQQCVSVAMICDGKFDCQDKSDESDTCDIYDCLNRSKKCSNGRICVHISKICDGEDDCGDRSDEMDCGTYNCMKPWKKCADNENCVSITKICNGRPDCPDKSDEVDCGVNVILVVVITLVALLVIAGVVTFFIFKKKKTKPCPIEVVEDEEQRKNKVMKRFQNLAIWRSKPKQTKKEDSSSSIRFWSWPWSDTSV